MDIQPIRIAITDDHKLMRETLINMINSVHGLKVVLDAENGDDLITKLSVGNNLPDVCLLDISMPQKNGYDTMKDLKKGWPAIKVLVLSMLETDYSILRMLTLGAKGYLNKDFTSIDQLKDAIVSVHEKGYYQSESVSQKTFRALSSGHDVPKISEYEMIFLKYCCSDYSYEEIASFMRVSKRTVEGYRDSLFLKLGIKSRNALTLFALKNGLVALGND
jgi:two-component system invasion response regulator UvrY